MFPQFPEAHQNIGHLYDTQNDLLSARKHHDLSVKYASSAQFNASAIVNLVLVERKLQPLQSLPQLQKLSSLLDDAEALEPNNVNVIFTHALILEYMGEISLCTAKLKRVITLDDRHPLAWLNLGNQWFRANDFDVAAKFYKNALERLPIEDVYNRVLVLNNLGQCYRERGHLRLAYEAFHDALKAIQSTSTTASTDGSPIATPELHHVNEKITAGIDYSGGRYDGKAVHFWCINNLYTIQGMLCDWRGFESLEEQIQKFIYAPEERSTNNNSGDVGKYQLSSFSAEGVQLDAYTMSLLRYASQATDKYVCQQSCLVQPLYSEHTDLATQQQQSAGGGVDSVPPRSAAGVPSPVTKRTLQVAYLSHDWRDHPMGRLTATLVTGHHQDSAILSTYHSKSRYAPNVPMSKQGSFPHRINATAVSYGANDKSNIREYVERHANAFVDILKVPNDMEAAEMLHQRNFDVVVDITGHTYNGRIEIAALRPAPIIINYLGFPGTTGCTGFDYSMVQSTIVPPEIAGSLFTERMLYLPYTYQVNDMLLRVAPEDLVRGDATSVRGKLVRSKFESSVGDEADVAGQRENSDVPVVPVNSLLLCSFNANKKMEPVSFLSWMNILHRVPSAVLVLLSVSSDTKANIFQELSYYGIVHRRVVFIPKRNWRRHLMRSAECDLVLDTFVYGAHTTASDVLWMGAPLLSLAAFGSQRMPSRVAASITQALSVPSNCVDAHSSPVEPAHILVVDSIRQYEDTAVRYLRSIRSVRTALTRSILHRAVRGAAFDSELMQKTVEFAYQAAHEARSVTRATPSHIPVLPHIFIPDFFSASQSAHVDKSAFSCGASWIKKFQRDLQQCCELSHDEINHLFADLKSLGQVREGGFATSSHSGQGISEILTGCQQRILAASDEKQVCGGTDHQALLRRIKWLYPALSVTTEAAMVPIVANVATIFKPATTQVSQQEYSAPAEIFDCTAELTLQIATQLFVELSDDADRSKGRFLRALQYCFEDSAPIVVDFLLSVHNTFQDRSLCAAEVAFFEFTQPVFFTSDNQVVSDSERASGAQLLKRLSSVTTYLSPLWRSLPAFDLRNIVLNHLLPLHLRHLRSPGGRSVTQRVYEDHLRMYLPRVAAVFPVTVCSKFLTEHGVVLSAEAESAHCMGFLSQQLAVILSGHSICLSQLAGRQLSDGDLAAALPFTLAASQRAVLDMVAAFKLDPTDQRLLNLGTVLMDAQMSEIGYFLSSVAALRRLKALPPIEYVTTGSSVPISLAAEMAESATLADDLSPKPRIVFYCDEYGQGWWKGWGPSSFLKQADGSPAKGMGGSEEAVYYTSIELARLGYDVTIYSSVTGADHGSVYHYAADGTVVHSSTVSDTISLGNYDDIKHGGKLGDSLAVGSVTWMQHDTYNPAPRQAADVRCEVFIAWRYAISLGLARQPRHFAGCGRKYLWLHDLIPGNILPPSFFLHFDGILVQSDFHKSFIRNAFATHETAHSYVNMTHAEAGIAVIPNGISQLRPTDENVSSKNNNSVFVYGSAPGRGLEHVLSQWGAIKKAIPSATLEVYYGFTDAAVEGLKASMGAGFERWYRQMQEYLLQDGVQYFGAVDHETLTDAYARAGFLLYPTTFQETGCITVLRAMAGGAIPITSRLRPSVLPTLTATHDLGPAEPLTVDRAGRPAVLQRWLREEWTPAVIRAHYLPVHELCARRESMKEMTRSTYSWTQTARKLVQLFDNV